MTYAHFSSCVNWPREQVDELVELIDRNLEITWKTFIRYVSVKEIREMFPDYTYTGQTGTGCFHIKDDWSVSFHRSRYRGLWCYYVRWSAIEFVWIHPSL